MAFPAKPSSRYSSYDARSSASSLFSDQPSSSVELKSPSIAPAVTSRALARANPSDLSKGKPQKLSSMMRNLMSKAKSGGGSSNKAMRLVIPSDVIAQDLKKTAKKQGMGMGLGELPRKLFGVDKEKKKKKEVKALTDLKGNGNGNARTLAMVLRSERELLSSNKELEMEIADLKLMLEQKNKEVEKLKDLCLSQREEIKSLKNAVLFPDARNNQVQDLVDKQGSELKQAKQVIPALQRQITSLTSQLQCLADDLAEVEYMLPSICII
ncbi:hypothetical protein SAY86_030874 [Trapa natans]|uniref:Uncharacterized protein n=1 Tax=Trapa natans TaxID=22666 RepID=A0AAN7MT12_TRANT|nr:hypothetical protein SAY86_030874 [Trapa natans]